MLAFYLGVVDRYEGSYRHVRGVQFSFEHDT